MNINKERIEELKENRMKHNVGLFVDKKEKLAIEPKTEIARSILVWLKNTGEAKKLRDVPYKDDIVDIFKKYSTEIEDDTSHTISEIETENLSKILKLSSDLESFDLRIKTLGETDTLYVETKNFKFVMPSKRHYFNDIEEFNFE